MKTLVCLLEEESAGEMLRHILPRLLPADVVFKCFPFEGKQDLEKNLTKFIRHWNTPNSFFLILRDQDSGDCQKIKRTLTNLVEQTGKQERALIRIACHALESFYLGDLLAVEKGLKIKGLSRHQENKKYRHPDLLANSNEELLKLTHKKYLKVSGSRAIAPHLNLDGLNRSKSFDALQKGLVRLLAEF